jgi:RNA recognition motif-containing protein
LSPLSNRLRRLVLKNIYVGNLDFGATEDSLRALFEPFGSVERVTIMTDRDTGRSRGFGFVEMTDEGEAERAISGLNGKNFGGRPLTVNEARPKPERSGGPRGGGYGDRGGSGGGGFARKRREPRW